MKDQEIWNMLTKHLSGEESLEEKEKFMKWFDESEMNKGHFYKVQSVWDDSKIINEKTPLSLRERFTKQKIKDFIYKQAIGNLVGFIVGMWVTTMFSHYVLERRGLQNLFGLSILQEVKM